METVDWDPELYLKFNRERTRPSIDLVSRITFDRPGKIVDIGCGPGNSTRVLAHMWPDTKITGVDNSASMIEKARKDYPALDWRILDIMRDPLGEKFDIVFSNAVIQWIPDHGKLIRKFRDLLTDHGLIAVQTPLFNEMPVRNSISKIAENIRWAPDVSGVDKLFTFHDYSYYYDLLAGLFKTVDIWQTRYIHIMESHNSILAMMRSTGLKPYLERLKNDTDKTDFERLLLEEIKDLYPQQRNGKVLFPFNRLFFIAGI